MDWDTLKRALLQGGLGLFDRELRRWAEGIAQGVRQKMHFTSDAQRGLVERLLGSLRGFFEGLVEQNLSSDFWKVFLEKNIDLADFITSFIFEDRRGIDEWS